MSRRNLPVLWRIQLFLPTALLELLLQRKNRFFCVLVSVQSTIYVRMLREQTGVEDAKSWLYWWSSWQITSLARTTLATKSPWTKTILNILTKAVVMSSKLIWPTGISFYWLSSLAGRPGKKPQWTMTFPQAVSTAFKIFCSPLKIIENIVIWQPSTKKCWDTHCIS